MGGNTVKKRFAAFFLSLLLLMLAGGCSARETAAPSAEASVSVSAADPSAEPVPTGTGTAQSDPVESPAASAAPAAASTAEKAASASKTDADKPAQTPAATAAAVSQAPEQTPEPEKQDTCTLWIRCDTILDHLDKIDSDVAALVPDDGLLYHGEKLPFETGESVFDLLLRVTRQQKIPLEFTDTPLGAGTYVEGIGNLYEFDCGELSGWAYKVNGAFPGVSCSRYTLKDGDVVEWVYTCDLGRDVGNPNSWEG